MRVWIENPFDDLPGEGFRPGRYTLMAEAFCAAGHDVTRFSSDFSHTTKQTRATDDSSIVLIPTRPYKKNISLARILSHRAYAQNWERRAQEVAAATGKPDLIIVSLPPLATGDVALSLARRFGASLVADIQDAWPETFARFLPRPLAPLAPLILAPFSRAARRLYRGADLVTGVCDRYRALAYAAPARAFKRFYLGMRFQRPLPAPRIVSSAGPRLAYAGGLGPTYDLTTVLDALRLVPSATLDIAGDGPERTTLEHAVRARALTARVTFHGRLSAEALAALLSSCEAGLVPMTDDSFVGIPNKVADYSAAALPVISSLRGECDELLARHQALIPYQPHDATSLAAAIQALQTRTTTPDFAGLQTELDATRIYADYVRTVTQLRPRDVEAP